METETFKLAAHSVRQEKGVMGVSIYSEKGDFIFENMDPGNWGNHKAKVEGIINLSHESLLDNKELYFALEEQKVFMRFFSNSVITAYCNTEVNYTSLNIVLKLAANKIEKGVTSKSEKVSHLSRFQKSRESKKSTTKTTNILLIVLKKLIGDFEGPMSNVIYKKALKKSQFQADLFTQGDVENLVDSIVEIMGHQNRTPFKARASRLIQDHFS